MKKTVWTVMVNNSTNINNTGLGHTWTLWHRRGQVTLILHTGNCSYFNHVIFQCAPDEDVDDDEPKQ